MHAMSVTNFGRPFVICLLAVACGSSAFAQFGGGMGGGMGGSRRSGSYDRGPRQEKPQDPSSVRSLEFNNSTDQILTRLGTLQFDLQLNADQLPHWAKFDDRLRLYLDDLSREKMKTIPVVESQPMVVVNALTYVSKMVDVARNRYANLEEVEIAVKALYQNLTPTQKIIFDARLPFILVRELGR
jgi:hypothetical protein